MTTHNHDLFISCRNGDLEAVNNICNIQPEKIHQVDAKSFTPLIIAVYNNQPAVVQLLLQKGARVNDADISGNTALMGVCFKGYKDIAEMLIKAGAEINQQNNTGSSALIFAATFGQLDIAQLLLDNGADVYLADSRGKTPLDYAALQQNDTMITLLSRYTKLQTPRSLKPGSNTYDKL